MRAAIFLPNWIGDVAMATPTLRALRDHWGPQAHLIGVMKPYVQDVLNGLPWLNETIAIDAKKLGRIGSAKSLIRSLRQAKCETAVLLNSSFATSLVSWLAGCRQRVGFPRNGRGIFLTHAVSEPSRKDPAFQRGTVDQYLEIAQALGASTADRRLELAVTKKDEAEARHIVNELGWLESDPFVVMNNGGAFGPSKNWPEEHFASLSRRVAEHWGMKVLLLCGPAERQAAARTERQAAHPLVKAYTQAIISIGASKALIRAARGMVTTDTGPRHFAAAFRVPSVVLFGPIAPQISHNYHQATVPLSIHLECSPCMRPVCPLGHHRCMRDLTVESAFTALQQSMLMDERGLVHHAA